MEAILDPEETTHADLRAGTAPWRSIVGPPRRFPLANDMRCDVVVVGGGITGALVADRLVRSGQTVVVVDRERAGYGSTAASTAMLQWEIDATLTELADRYGFERAAKIYRLSFAAAGGLRQLIAGRRIPCRFRPRQSLYLAGEGTSAVHLEAEHELRERAGLPGVYLDRSGLAAQFAIDRSGAIISPGSAEADPLCLAHAVLAGAVANGLRLVEDEVIEYGDGATTVSVGLGSGRTIEASHCVLATGYVMPSFVQSSRHAVRSSFAIATRPQPRARLWRGGVLIWEAADPYIYARTTADGRVVIGGEDDGEAIEPAERNRLMPEKARILRRKLADLWPQADLAIEHNWSGAFGETDDGLPLIGPVPGRPRILAAYGYGGNGITFSFLAARMIAEMVAGRRHVSFDAFAIDR